MVENPLKAYGALLVLVAAAVSAAVIAAGFVAPDAVIRGDTFWVFIGAIVVMILCAVVSWTVNLPRIVNREFRQNGGDR